MKTISTITACCFVAVLASGCVSQGNQNVRHSQDQQYYVVRGTIENIEHVSSGSAGQSSGLGAVGGAVRVPSVIKLVREQAKRLRPLLV